MPIDALAEVARSDPRAQAKLAQSVEREFEARRDELCGAGQRQPIERVAALLVTSARTNVQQGRPAELIKDSWKCGVIADLLQLTLDDLSAILVDLQRRGLIEAAGEDLRLTDIAGAGSDGGRRLAGQRSRRSACAQSSRRPTGPPEEHRWS